MFVVASLAYVILLSYWLQNNKESLLLGELDDEMSLSVFERQEGVAIVMVVHDELAAFEDSCQDNHKQGGDGRWSLQPQTKQKK